VPSRRIHVLCNSRSARSGQDLDDALAVLRRNGDTVNLVMEADPAAMPERIARIAADADVIVIGGGDGTMASCGDVLERAGRPVGILPLGNACDLARSLGIPRDPVAACEVIAAGNTHPIDMARVNGHTYFNMASMGLSVGVARRLSPEVKRRWGILSYPRLVWDALRAMRSFHADIDCDGRQHRVRTIQLGVGNGFYYGAGLTVAHDARLDDNLLHVYAIKPASRMRLLTLLPRIKLGRLAGLEIAEVLKGRSITVATRKPRSVNADGEVVTKTPATFTVTRGALEIFVPAGAVPPALEPKPC